MKIKDIRQFRTFYKEEINGLKDVNNRDEHFIGAVHEDSIGKKWGYFSITHGDKEKQTTEGIRGFLEGFLDMARDAQAVYEFLQNAVDANSSRFAMSWGKDEVDGEEYLLVLNNGKQFDFASVRSILNVGVSTKNPEEHTIGKFGIGFKLAHRLVGKDNGLDELLNRNYGPILFSWKNGDLDKLFKYTGQNIEKATQSYKINKSGKDAIVEIAGDDPWLFKILITNFPCQPDEEIRDAYYRPTLDAFSKPDIIRLSNWLNRFSEQVPLKDYQEGSLFFVRLGEGKKIHLEDSNLEEGVKFSLSILNHASETEIRGLKHVHVNGTDLESVDLQFWNSNIGKNSEEYRYIRFGSAGELTADQEKQALKDSDIQLLMGYVSHKKAHEIFHNAPNFYLYFPLSEEKHKLRFVIHSNAFYKASHRTSLHIGTQDNYGINERLLFIFSEKLKFQLTEWVNSAIQSDRQRFLDIYANLLISDESTDINRDWINKPLVKPLHEFLKVNIPVVDESNDGEFKLENSPNKVRIKSTKIPIKSSMVTLDFSWFLWSDDSALSNEAIGKLNIKTFTIIDLLKIRNSANEINTLLNNNPSLIKSVLDELDICLSSDQNIDQVFKDNFVRLSVYSFENGKVYTISQLCNEPDLKQNIILFSAIDPISSLIRKAGFILSSISLSSYKYILSYLQTYQVIEYFEYSELNKFLSKRFEKTVFSIQEKHLIFKTLEEPNKSLSAENRNQRMQVLKLFSNQKGDVMPLGLLLKNAQKEWLKVYNIKTEEYHEDLSRYLIPNDTEAYKCLIIPFWDTIISDKNGQIRSNPGQFYQDIIDFQSSTRFGINLTNRRFILFNNEFIEPDPSVFYISSWQYLEHSKYVQLKAIFSLVFSKNLPDQKSLLFLQSAPFNLAESTIESLFLAETKILSKEEIELILKSSSVAKLQIFEKFILIQKDTLFHLKPLDENEIQVWASGDANIIKYIQQFHPELHIAPQFDQIKELVLLKDNELMQYFIDHWDSHDESKSEMLANVLLTKQDDLKVTYLEKLDQIKIDAQSFDGIKNLYQAVRIALSMNNISKAKESFEPKVSILVSGVSFGLNEILGEESENIEFGKNNDYLLKLSELFTHQQVNKRYYVEDIINRLTQYGITDRKKLEVLFNISDTVDLANILNKLNLRHALLGYLENPVQLAFVLLYHKFINDSLKLNTYKIKDADSLKSLVGAFGVSVSIFGLFKPETYLPLIYTGLDTLLNITPEQPLFKTGSVQFHLFPIVEGDILESPPIRASLNPDEIITLFESLLKTERFRDELKLDQGWEEILGFNPKLIVSSHLCLKPDEELPGSILQWSLYEQNEELRKKKAFLLTAIGFNLPWSNINRLRSELLVPENPHGFEIAELDLIHPKLIANTFSLIAKQNPGFTISAKDLHFSLLTEMVFRCFRMKLLDQPLPVNLKDLGFYQLSSVDNSNCYYYDSVSYQYLSLRNLSIEEIMTKVPEYIFDATIWGSSEELKKKLKPVDIKEKIDVDSLHSNSIEWNDRFYIDWKQQNSGYEIRYTDYLPVRLYIEDIFIKETRKDLFYCEKGILYTPRKFSFTEVINEVNSNQYLPTVAISSLVGLHDKYNMKVQDLLKTNFINQVDIRERVDEMKREFEELAERQEIRERLAHNKYTFQWFQDFIKLELLNSSAADSIIPEKEITFFNIEQDPGSKRIVVFKDPNRTITPTIEYCADFYAIIETKSGGIVNVQIQGVSKKGQTVLAFLSNPNSLLQINLNDVKKIDLHFKGSIDLLGRLLNSFRRLGHLRGWVQYYDLKEQLPENIQFIFGPPGTGKTTYLAQRIAELISTEKDLRILVLTPTNKAADVIAEKVIEKSSLQNDWLVRYGATFKNILIENDLLKDANSFMLDSYDSLAFITTIHRFPYEEVVQNFVNKEPQMIRICDIPWDYIIFDESSMISLSYITYVLHEREYKYDNVRTSFIVGGDPLQIPPIIDIPNEDLPEGFDKDENIYSMIELNSFVEKDQKLIPKYGQNIINLTTQYRSIESIGKLFSYFSYEGLVEHGRARGQGGSPLPRPLPLSISKLGIKPISLIRFPVNSEDSIFSPSLLRKSPYHIYSAILLYELIRVFEKELDPTEKWSIGIVCPYRSQATLINKMIESLHLPANLSVMTDTVHGFQGDECDLVFFLLIPPNSKIFPSYKGAFIHKHYLINVAISRPKDYLVILYPDNDTTGIENLQKIHKSNSSSIEYLIENLLGQSLKDVTSHSYEIEAKLFNDKNHIENNVFTNEHQLVNVYNISEKKYFIKESSTAIDIQFKTL